jgi:hypothetical protein
MPAWLQALNSGSTLGPGGSATFNLRVDRSTVPAGDYNTNFSVTVVGDASQTQIILVHMKKN